MRNDYKRILLKLSGESLMGDQEFGIDAKIIGRVEPFATGPKGIHTKEVVLTSPHGTFTYR